MGLDYLILEKIRDLFLSFVNLSLICNLLFKMFMVGMRFVINDIPNILWLLFVIWNNCLKAFSKSLFCFIVRVGMSDN